MLEIDFIIPEEGVAFEGTEVFSPVFLNLNGRQQLDIKIPRGKPERPAFVAADNGGNIARADFPNGACHPGRTMVIGRDRQRPGLQLVII